MSYFHVKNGELHVENVALQKVAEAVGTPCYVYSRAALTAAYRDFAAGFAGRDSLICYAVKANPNLAVLNCFARLGSGFDIVSGGELRRVLAAGGNPQKTVFSGVGKSPDEIAYALAEEILCFNVESPSELILLNRIAAEMGKIAPISLRVNPDVDAKTHPYIATGLAQNKFGIPIESALGLYREAATLDNLAIKGIDCHIGSQLTDIAPFEAALEKILSLVDLLESEGIAITHVDVGGGVGIRYKDEPVISAGQYAQAVLKQWGARTQKIILEPGRTLVGNAGLLLTKVAVLKTGQERNFAVVDAAMNDLLRPALYDAYHEILSVKEEKAQVKPYDIVGPVCESSDFLGRDRRLALAEGALLAVMSAGAYGMSMSSNYNTRPRAAEVMVDGGLAYLIQRRENIEALFERESILPEPGFFGDIP